MTEAGPVFVSLAAFLVAALTLFSGFGLGTLLLPVFALFFPIPVAVACTAIVHMANNVFKAILLRHHARAEILIRFGVTAIPMAFVGAAVLGMLSTRQPLATWHLGAIEANVTPIGLAMGLLILVFAALEIGPWLDGLRPSARWLPLGGALSGFFGGLSGHQGALRAVFISPLGLGPEAFAATQAVLACMVDVARLLVYGAGLSMFATGAGDTALPFGLVAGATASALAGSLLGKKLLPRMTVRSVRIVTATLLVVVGVTLATGITG